MELLDQYIKRSPHLDWLNTGTIYLHRSGSHAYGTNIQSSDEDWRGIAIPPPKYFFSFQHNFEQAELKDPDSCIYDLKKFFRLAFNANPNIIEMLWVDPSDQYIVSPLAEKLINARQYFLSKKAKFSFSGYSYSQILRMKVHRKWLLNPPTHFPTRKELGLPEQTLIPKDQLEACKAAVEKEINKFNFDFLDGHSEDEKIALRLIMSEMLAKLKISLDDIWVGSARLIGLSDNLIEVMKKEREYETRKRNWDQYQNWKKTRNPKRAELEEKFGFDCKHAGHVYRLLVMCEEILTTGKVVVKRPDKDVIIGIRNGAWTYDQILEFAEKQEKKCDELYNTTSILPHAPNAKYLDNLCQEIITEALETLYSKKIG